MKIGEELDRKQNNGLINLRPDSFYGKPKFKLLYYIDFLGFKS